MSDIKNEDSAAAAAAATTDEATPTQRYGLFGGLAALRERASIQDRLVESSVHWIVPTIGGGVLSANMLLVFVAYFNYLVDVYLMYAASALAANTVVRSAGGAAAPLFTRQMFSAMGIGGGGSLVGGVGALLAIIPFLFYKYGPQIRARSKFSPTGLKSKEEQNARFRSGPDEESALETTSNEGLSRAVGTGEQEK